MSALLDTGSTVSTVSESYYQQHLQHLTLYPINDFLHIECADGGTLPYSGYIEASITSTGLPSCLDSSTKYPILVVPNSNYNRTVPVLLGTNILHHLLSSVQSNYGDQYLQRASLHTPWYLAFRMMTLQEKELRKQHNRLGIVKCAEKKTGHHSSEHQCHRVGLHRQVDTLPVYTSITPCDIRFSHPF